MVKKIPLEILNDNSKIIEFIKKNNIEKFRLDKNQSLLHYAINTQNFSIIQKLIDYPGLVDIWSIEGINSQLSLSSDIVNEEIFLFYLKHFPLSECLVDNNGEDLLAKLTHKDSDLSRKKFIIFINFLKDNNLLFYYNKTLKEKNNFFNYCIKNNLQFYLRSFMNINLEIIDELKIYFLNYKNKNYKINFIEAIFYQTNNCSQEIKELLFDFMFLVKKDLDHQFLVKIIIEKPLLITSFNSEELFLFFKHNNKILNKEKDLIMTLIKKIEKRFGNKALNIFFKIYQSDKDLLRKLNKEEFLKALN